MKWGGNSDFSKMVFQDVTPPSMLVWHHSSADSDWKIITSPMMADWPRVLLTTVKFEDMGDKTNVRLSQLPIEATLAISSDQRNIRIEFAYCKKDPLGSSQRIPSRRLFLLSLTTCCWIPARSVPYLRSTRDPNSGSQISLFSKMTSDQSP